MSDFNDFQILEDIYNYWVAAPNIEQEFIGKKFVFFVKKFERDLGLIFYTIRYKNIVICEGTINYYDIPLNIIATPADLLDIVLQFTVQTYFFQFPELFDFVKEIDIKEEQKNINKILPTQEITTKSKVNKI